MVRKLSRAGSTHSPRPRLRALSHPKSRAPGPPRLAQRPCWPRLPTLQSGPGRRRGGEGGDDFPWAAAAEDSRTSAHAAGGSEGAPGQRGLQEGDGGGTASAPGGGGAGGEGSGPVTAARPPLGAGSSAPAPAASSPSGLRGPKGNMTNAPAPDSRPLPRRPTPQRSRSSRHFRRAAA